MIRALIQNRYLVMAGLSAAVAVWAFFAMASTRTARAEPEPCALPERMPAEIELHDGMSATEAAYSEWIGLEGGMK